MQTDKQAPPRPKTKAEVLMQMFTLSREAVAAMLEASRAAQSGDLAAARTCLEKQIRLGREHLALALRHNEQHPPPVPIEPIVQPTVTALLTLADTLQSLNEPDQAERARQDALDLAKAHLSPAAQVEAERSLVAGLTGQARFSEALVRLMKCRDLLLEQGDPVPLVRVTIDLVDLLHWLGDHQRALDELGRVATRLESLAGRPAAAKRNIVDSFLASAVDAVAGVKSGKEILDHVGLQRAALEADYYRALIFRSLGRHDEAEALFRVVQPEYTKLGVGPAIEFQLAAVAAERGAHSRALEIAGKIEAAISRDDRMRPKLAALLKVEATALHGLGRSGEALALARRGIEELSRYHDPDVLWGLWYLQGRILEETGSKAEALDALAQGADVVNRLRRVPLGYRLDSTYLGDKLPLFRKAIELAAALAQGERCCRLMEMVKSRILSTVLATPRIEPAATSPDPLKNRVAQLTQSLEAIEYASYRQSLPPAELQAKTNAVLQERDELLQRIRFSDPRWRILSEPVPFDLPRVTSLLASRHQTALALYWGEDRIVSVLVGAGELRASTLAFAEKERQALQTYLDNLGREVSDPALRDPSRSLALGARHFVPPELLDLALRGDGLIVVPHGPLHLLPWAGLIYQGRRLFEYCPVAVLPNLSLLVHCSTQPFSPQPKVAVIGPPDYTDLRLDPLRGAAEECRQIHQLYSEANRAVENLLIDKTSTEEAFWQLAGRPEAAGAILHLACHGLADPVDPMHSGLLLGNGRIDASEIAAQTLRFDEVYLAACSTGIRPLAVRGVALTGDEVLGLPGAFLEAGVRSIIVSIPPSDDQAASAFAIQYHQHRFSGKPPMVALREAQKHLHGTNAYQPYQWLGFTLYGSQ